MLIKHLVDSQLCAQYMHFIYSSIPNDEDEVIIIFYLQMKNFKLEEIK